MKTYSYTNKGRKSWLCSICGRTIPKGQPHTYEYDYGGVNERRICQDCRPLEDQSSDKWTTRR